MKLFLQYLDGKVSNMRLLGHNHMLEHSLNFFPPPSHIFCHHDGSLIRIIILEVHFVYLMIEDLLEELTLIVDNFQCLRTLK
jgi:hypothetical protein